jgi:hypothetical protein
MVLFLITYRLFRMGKDVNHMIGHGNHNNFGDVNAKMDNLNHQLQSKKNLLK